MTTESTETRPAWTVAEAKAKLSEILRLAEEEGPQRIGLRNSFVIVPERVWLEHEEAEPIPMGRWIVENWPRGIEIELPDRRDPEREVPFAHVDEDDWTDQ